MNYITIAKKTNNGRLITTGGGSSVRIHANSSIKVNIIFINSVAKKRENIEKQIADVQPSKSAFRKWSASSKMCGIWVKYLNSMQSFGAGC